MRTLAIIPARGGSKRIPGKNLAEVGGVPLVELALLSAKPCSDVVVSTDDPGVAVLAAQSWAPRFMYPKLHARRPEHATDTAQLEPVIDDVLAQFGEGIEAIVLLQPTSPFRTAAHVEAALALLAKGYDSVLSVRRLHSLHPVFHGDMAESGAFIRRVPMVPGSRPRSQDLRLGHEDGCIYAFTAAHWRRTGSRCGGREGYIELNRRESFEIDTPDELEVARAIAAAGAR